MMYWMTLSMVAALAVWVLMPAWINALTSSSFFQPIREDGPVQHHLKVNTPSMGGVVLWAMWSVVGFYGTYASSALLRGWFYLVFGYFLIGLYDDLLKVFHKNAYALRPKPKFLLQCAWTCLVLLWLMHMGWLSSLMIQKIPGWGGYWHMPYWIGVPLWIWVVVGSANAINLVDGLDGLASGVVVTIALGLWVCNQSPVSHELNGPLMVLWAVLISFLWFNHKPASIMMGDSGSLFLGSALAYAALASKLVFFYAIMALVPIATTCSVILQVLYYKRTQRRLFKMAPLHHHFELSGVPETTIVMRTWIVSGLCVLGAYICLLCSR